ncbi:HAMP domain-containing protein [Aliivibrio fischeri]|nr:HAMP domain-containing protein [Aliivibrio fischeri]
MINLNKDMNELSQLVTQSIKNNQYRVSTFRSDGFIIANSKLEYIGKNIFTLYGGSLDKYTADLNRIVDIDGFYNYTSYEPNANMYINISISKDYIYSQARNSAIISIFIAIVSILIVLVFTSYFLKKQLATPLAKITGIAEKITAGNLNNDIDLNEFHPDEIGYLANSFYEMQSSLSRVITSSASISNHVASSSEELIVVMKKTAQNTQNELAQMEEVSTAISELSSTAREVSSNAVQAEDETRKAIEFVNSGHKALEQSIALTTIINSSVKDTADLIEALKNSSVDIGEVTHVISSISEQINLLALNAAIEAARAGEHGRGFAVVADEVRVLASKTQESTKNIQEIISSLQVRSEDANRNMISNVTSIQESVDLSVLVKASFEDISHSVQVISDINALVATASQEQYSVTEDIAKNTTRTFDLVNDNVTAVNQTQQAAQELAVLADKQNQELSFFKLSH